MHPNPIPEDKQEEDGVDECPRCLEIASIKELNDHKGLCISCYYEMSDDYDTEE